MQPCSYEWYNRRNPTVDGRRIVTLLEQVVTHAEWRGDGAPKPSLLSSKLVHRLGPASADTLVLPRERVPKLPTSVVHDVVRLQATGGLTPRQAMEPLPAVCCSRYRPVVEMSGHRWMAAYCLQFDASGRAIVSGADDQLRTPGPGTGDGVSYPRHGQGPVCGGHDAPWRVFPFLSCCTVSLWCTTTVRSPGWTVCGVVDVEGCGGEFEHNFEFLGRPCPPAQTVEGVVSANGPAANDAEGHDRRRQRHQHQVPRGRAAPPSEAASVDWQHCGLLCYFVPCALAALFPLPWNSPCNTMVAACCGSNPGEPGIIRVWNLQTGEPVRVLQGHTNFVASVMVVCLCVPVCRCVSLPCCCTVEPLLVVYQRGCERRRAHALALVPDVLPQCCCIHHTFLPCAPVCRFCRYRFPRHPIVSTTPCFLLVPPNPFDTPVRPRVRPADVCVLRRHRPSLGHPRGVHLRCHRPPDARDPGRGRDHALDR